MPQVTVSPMDDQQLVTPEDSRYIRARCVVLAPGKEVGNHSTGDKEEVIILLQGKVIVSSPGREQELPSLHGAYIPPNTKHNISNPFDEDAIYVYVRSLDK